MREYRLYLYAQDPTHIGAGGYRLSRVDNTILRDAASDLPKIPGSSISGLVRTAAIYKLPTGERENAMLYARRMLQAQPDLAGGEADPIAQVFGFAEGEKGQSRIGMVAFRDAQILAFPVPTIAGPRWISTAEILTQAGGQVTTTPDSIAEVVQQGQDGLVAGRASLGTFLLNSKPGQMALPDGLGTGASLPGLDFVQSRLILVHPDLFSSLINLNLETRTSVVIDFATGTAADRLLFTYEATPRGTLFAGSLELDDERFPELADKASSMLKDALPLAFQWGIGGMTTRGFGKMRHLLIEEK